MQWFLSAFPAQSNLLNSAHGGVAPSRRLLSQGLPSLRNRQGNPVQAARRGGFAWREIDVESDDELRRRFTDEVPVVFIDGHKAFKYHMDEREFLRKLAS